LRKSESRRAKNKTKQNKTESIMKNYLIIVGNDDTPLYEYCFTTNLTNISIHNNNMNLNNSTNPINTTNPTNTTTKTITPKDDLLHFILHSALDTVDTKLFSTSYLAATTSSSGSATASNLPLFYRGIDKYNDYLISVFITFSQCKFLFVHESRMDENILKNLLCEIFEYFLIYRCNPFVDTRKPIISRAFDERIRLIGEKYITK
jgi:hypothetical protein